MFINDVGETLWEEINDGIAGSNYGWNTCEGACSPPNSNFRDPLFQYSHGTLANQGCAIVGGGFYNPTTGQFPASYVGKYFFGDLCNTWIRVFDPATGTASDFATGFDPANNPIRNLFTGINIDLAVRNTNAVLHRVSYQVTIKGKIAFVVQR